MQFSTTVLALLAAVGSASAAPAAAGSKSQMANGQSWTIQSMKRTCSSDGKACTYSYGINANDGKAPAKCHYDIKGNGAARATYGNIKCGDYTISSSWSGQFGEGNGFQVLAVVKGKQIIYPGYTDKQLNTQQTVKPDQSYTPQATPGN